NSTNGTSVNNQPVSEATLKHLDQVRFAEVSAMFDAEATVAGQQSPAATSVAAKPSPRSEPAPAGKPTPATIPAPHSRRRTRPALIYACGVIILVGISAAGWYFLHGELAPDRIVNAASPPGGTRVIPQTDPKSTPATPRVLPRSSTV